MKKALNFWILQYPNTNKLAIKRCTFLSQMNKMWGMQISGEDTAGFYFLCQYMFDT